MVNRKSQKRQREESAEDELKAAGLLQCLERQESLYELHTHLLGMGNASFWVQSILTDQKKLPTQDDFINSDLIRLQLGPLVWDNEKRRFIDLTETKTFFDQLRRYGHLKYRHKSTWHVVFRNLVSDKFSQELAHCDLSFKNNFSYDIVLSLDDLAKGLGLKENQPRDMIQAMIEEKLGVYTRSDWQNENSIYFKNWIIFNARKQELQIVYGIQTKYLRMLIGGAKPIHELTDPAQRDARAHIINAFSMMNADGSEPRSVDFHSFRGAFTPEFFPRRFALKDSIYSQRLDLLAFLLRNALHRFSTCLPPIKYCEFSIGCGDLSRPWVFDVLSTFSKHKQLSGSFQTLVDDNHFPWLKRQHFEQNTDYRFLAGFNRRILRVSNAYSADEAVAFLFEVPHYAIHIMLREFYQCDNRRQTILFGEQVKQLQEMKKEADVNSHFFDWVVGLDLFGDELGYPYCPFVAYDFLQFVQDARKQNPDFGVRIHCAENVPFVRPELSGYRLFAAHMYIVYRCLDFLKKKLNSNIRIGHGIAFDKLLSIKNYKFRKSSVLVAEMQGNAKSLLSTIPFEVNITSNFYLLGDAIRNVENAKPLSSLYKMDVPVVLSTDDDGIWPIDKCSLGHQAHHSLAAEYCRAITTRFITKEDQLENMIANVKRFCFKNKRALSKQKHSKTEIDIDISTGHYFPTDIIVHPNVLHMLFDKKQWSNIDSCHCLKYYKNIYGSKMTHENEDVDNDWENHCELMAPVVVACFYLTHSLPYAQYKTEYEILFGSHLCKQIYSACENVYSQLINDVHGQGVHMHLRIDEEDYLFCSEVPDNRNRAPDFLLNTIEDFILRSPAKATVFSFLSSIDIENERIKSRLDDIDRQIIDKEINIFIHTNTAKHSIFLDNKSGKLLINNKPEQRTGPKQENIACALYAVCPHGSVATVALRFIAQYINKNSFYIKPQHIHLRALIIPFLPLCFGYPATSKEESKQERKNRFLEHYSINNTNLAGKIDVKKRSTCRTVYDSKYNLLCSDVMYAEQIETKNLVEKIGASEVQFLGILKILHDSIDKFNLWPKSFVMLKNVSEYKLYKEFDSCDRIALPIICLGSQYLICSSTDFFEKKLQTSACRLWSLATGWNPPLSSRNNPYEYPYNKWVKSILKSDRQKLNRQFGKNTWETFLKIVLLDARRQAWFWFTVGRWCDVVEDAFSLKENLTCFMKFLKKNDKISIKFLKLLEDCGRHKIGNKWQKEVVKQRKANRYVKWIVRHLKLRRKTITYNE